MKNDFIEPKVENIVANMRWKCFKKLDFDDLHNLQINWI